jgi:hypothetical protein
VMGGVPVLGEDDVFEVRRDLMNDRDDGISARNGELPAGAEVVLDVDDEKNVFWCYSHRDDQKKASLRKSTQRRPSPREAVCLPHVQP